MTNQIRDLQKKLQTSTEKYKNSKGGNVNQYLSDLGLFFRHFGSSDLGVSLLRSIVGEENLYVHGQIYGIHPSSSVQQVFEEPQSRRFMGVVGEIPRPLTFEKFFDHL